MAQYRTIGDVQAQPTDWRLLHKSCDITILESSRMLLDFKDSYARLLDISVADNLHFLLSRQ